VDTVGRALLPAPQLPLLPVPSASDEPTDPRRLSGAAKTALRITGMPAGAAAYHFANCPPWLVALIVLLPLVLPEVVEAIHWFATRPQLSDVCTYVTKRLVGYAGPVARDMANHHAYDDSEILKLGAAPAPEPPKPKGKPPKPAIASGKPRPSRTRTRSTGASSAETVPDNDPDPPPQSPESGRGRHLRLVRPDETGESPEPV
jgi:hypothetical protein